MCLAHMCLYCLAPSNKQQWVASASPDHITISLSPISTTASHFHTHIHEINTAGFPLSYRGNLNEMELSAAHAYGLGPILNLWFFAHYSFIYPYVLLIVFRLNVLVCRWKSCKIGQTLCDFVRQQEVVPSNRARKGSAISEDGTTSCTTQPQR